MQFLEFYKLQNGKVDIGSASESIYKFAKFTTDKINKCLGSCASVQNNL